VTTLPAPQVSRASASVPDTMDTPVSGCPEMSPLKGGWTLGTLSSATPSGNVSAVRHLPALEGGALTDRGPTRAASRRNLLPLAGRLALRPVEAAEALGISERKLRQLLPRLPHVRLDGVVVLPVEGLRRWLAENVETGQSRVDAAVGDVLSELGAGRP